MDRQHSESESDDSVVAFAAVDFSGVDFCATTSETPAEHRGSEPLIDDEEKKALLDWEMSLGVADPLEQDIGATRDSFLPLKEFAALLGCGMYAEVVRKGRSFFDSIEHDIANEASHITVARVIRRHVVLQATTLMKCIELEYIAIAALNLFLQGNYTGPSFEDLKEGTLDDINPHLCFESILKASDVKTDERKSAAALRMRDVNYQNAVLAELSVDGEWPCHVCNGPYFLLIARSILSILSEPEKPDWAGNEDADSSEVFSSVCQQLTLVHLWNARAIVAHERLMQARNPSETLWNQVSSAFRKCVESFCPEEVSIDHAAAAVMLEFGLAEHHFNRQGKGIQSFLKAKEYSGLRVKVTGAEGKRTKFQQKATAQMLVRATSHHDSTAMSLLSENEKEHNKNQMIEHSKDGILLEKIKFEDEKENQITDLSILDQAILMALCLDVKNSNPIDGLTGEEMAAFLARVLEHHDDWMVYSTALLERSWLEFERSHARERAILQMQALADQHTNRLTITQSTKKSVEESAQVQNRLKNLHKIVYPPRWLMLQDLADRYANLGIVTSAAEIFTEIEFWDDVVDCYKRAGKKSKAEEIVRKRLSIQPTPRMWAALGDLKSDPQYYVRAAELSKGRFSSAYVSLGQHYFDKGMLEDASEQYIAALRIRPLDPPTWFRLGAISMQLQRWETALRAFSQVVQQEPEEAEAWANVAAVHMHNKHPAEAYPALVESLKYNRNNWRVWNSKLYTCLDLGKYDEAIQACNMLLDQRSEKQVSAGIPPVEEKCVRAIVGGALQTFQDSMGNEISMDSARRTLSRVYSLLERISKMEIAKPWLFDTIAFFHDQIGNDEKVMENLMKEYRSLLTIDGWEKDNYQIKKLCQTVSHVAHIHAAEGSRESLTKARIHVNGIVKRILSARPDDATVPEEVSQLEKVLLNIEEKIDAL